MQLPQEPDDIKTSMAAAPEDPEDPSQDEYEANVQKSIAEDDAKVVQKKNQ